MGPTVGIVGAGIGGLTLAHALRRRGIRCVVFDRDADARATAGYRLHLDEAAWRTLVDVLPPASCAALRDCAAGAEAFRQFAVLDHRGRTRLRLPIRHDGEILLIGRRPLRAILARGLEDTIRWGTPVSGYAITPAGVSVAGETVDVLVAADGTGSRIARQLIGRSTARPSGVIGVAGRAPLPQRAPADLRHGLAFMIGPGGVGSFLSLHTAQGSDPEAEDPCVVWSVAARREQFASDPAALSSPELISEASRLTTSWTPDFRTLLARSTSDSAAAFPFWFPAALRPWPTGPVTVLGDAIHPMPPTAGAGASTAIRDAAHLAADLATHDVDGALDRYRQRLLSYAPAAVAEARPPLFWQRRLANPLLRLFATELAMPAANALLAALPSRGDPGTTAGDAGRGRPARA